jgi:O-antigen ligase
VNFVILFLLSAALVLIQCLLGGTRMLYSFPSYAIIGAAAALSVFTVRRPLPKPAVLPLAASLLLAAYVVVRAYYSPIPHLALVDLTMAIACLAVYLIAALVLTDPRQRLLMVGVCFAIAVVEIGVGIVQFTQHDEFMLFGFLRPESSGRAGGMFISGNHFAGYLEAMAVIALALTLWSRLPLVAKLVTGYLVPACYLGVVISGSRGGYITSAASLFVFVGLHLWILRRIRRNQSGASPIAAIALVAAVVLGLGLAGTLMLKSKMIQDRLNRNVLKDIRVYNWMAAYDQFKLSPWVGTGAGTHLIYGRLFRRPQLQSDPVHAHSDYLEMLAEYGVIGEVLALFFLVAHVRNGLRGASEIAHRRLSGAIDRPRSDTLALCLGALTAVAGLMAHSVVDFNMHIPGNALLFAFLFGMLANPGADRPEAPASWVAPAPLLRLLLLPLGIGLAAIVIPRIQGERLSEAARVALRDRNYPGCVEKANQAIAAQPGNYSNYFYLGEAHRAIALTVGMPALRPLLLNRALDAYDRGLKIFPQDENLLVRRAQVLDGLRRFSDAEAGYQEALRWDPNLGVLYGYYGNHLKLMGLQEKADQAHEKGKALGGQNVVELGSAEARSLLE